VFKPKLGNSKCLDREIQKHISKFVDFSLDLDFSITDNRPQRRVLLSKRPLVHRLSLSFAMHLLEGGAILTVKELLVQPSIVMTMLNTPCAELGRLGMRICSVCAGCEK
jgi:hypothetical protein